MTSGPSKEFWYPPWKRVWLFGGWLIVIAVLGSAFATGRIVGNAGAWIAGLAIIGTQVYFLAVIVRNPARLEVTDEEVIARYYIGEPRRWARLRLVWDDTRSGLWGSYRVYDQGGVLQFQIWPGLVGVRELMQMLSSRIPGSPPLPPGLG